jgi:arginine exporter protein ArgO
MLMTYYFKGMMLSASLIMAIGAQNAFVLRILAFRVMLLGVE